MVKIEEVMLLTVLFMLALFLYGCMTETTANSITLGDEVQTTDRYTNLFDDSFSGKVVMKMPDGAYIVRNTDGTERTISRYWLDKVAADPNNLTDMRKR